MEGKLLRIRKNNISLKKIHFYSNAIIYPLFFGRLRRATEFFSKFPKANFLEQRMKVRYEFHTISQ